MGIFDTMKETVALLQKVDNLPLYRKVLELQNQINELVEENRRLKDRLGTRDQLTFRKNAYWRADDGPFCSRCWDSETRLVRLHTQQGYKPQCPSCGTVASDPDQPPPKPIQRRSSRSGYLDRNR